jgi:hypothetical protein
MQELRLEGQTLGRYLIFVQNTVGKEGEWGGGDTGGAAREKSHQQIWQGSARELT